MQLSTADIEALSEKEIKEAIAASICRDPLQIALDTGIPHARVVASQVKYLQRARRKLPSYYAACCILPSLAFEQSSGEQAAEHKASYQGGKLCIDLTCGLGVDAYHFSRRFEHVIAVERDPSVVWTARENFKRLGAGNIGVVEDSAERFITRWAADNPGQRADLIYLDPARRSGSGAKVAGLGDCSPDVMSLLPLLRTCGRRIMVKLSPMFDIAEVFRIFGPDVTVDVVSVGGECKEVLALYGEGITGQVIRASVIGSGSMEYPYDDTANTENTVPGQEDYTEAMKFLVSPDPAILKARLSVSYFRQHGGHIENNNGFAFYFNREDIPAFIPGTLYRIKSVRDYDPQGIKKELKKGGIRRLNILCRDFPEDAPCIAARLGIKEGGTAFAAFTRTGGRLRMMTIERER